LVTLWRETTGGWMLPSAALPDVRPVLAVRGRGPPTRDSHGVLVHPRGHTLWICPASGTWAAEDYLDVARWSSATTPAGLAPDLRACVAHTE
jgi:hypothetical protein